MPCTIIALPLDTQPAQTWICCCELRAVQLSMPLQAAYRLPLVHTKCSASQPAFMVPTWEQMGSQGLGITCQVCWDTFFACRAIQRTTASHLMPRWSECHGQMARPCSLMKGVQQATSRVHVCLLSDVDIEVRAQ